MRFKCKCKDVIKDIKKATIKVIDGKIRTAESLCECGEYMEEVKEEFKGFPTIHRKEATHSMSGLVAKANESIKRNEKK
jgi:hypothetical protein|tara:strand:- start:25 stop:261 length:237 start_codon:yes stop_codon:yes gene_type:complete